RPPQADDVDRITIEIDQMLADADAERESGYEGGAWSRQPVHTAYVPAHKFGLETARQWGKQARAVLEEFAPGPGELAAATGLAPGLADQVHPLVLSKLARQPIED